MKLPWVKWFFSDFHNDPKLSKCTPATRGVWVDLLGAMHDLDRSGELCGTAEELSRIARCSTVEVVQALTELKTTEAASVTIRNNVFTVVNRRMSREHKARQMNALRQKRFRGNADDNESVTPERSEVRGQNRSLSLSSSHPNPSFPTLLEVKTWASMDGIPDDQAEAFWNHFEAISWVDRNGNKITNARAKLKSWHLNERAKAHEKGSNGKPASGAQGFWELSKRLELVEKDINAIEQRAAHTATDMQVQPGDKATYASLRSQRAELKSKLRLTAK